MYCAYITSIKNLSSHSNADRLMCTTVFGNNVIVDKTYTIGQKVIYFPTDGQLSERFAKDNNLVRLENGGGGYLDPDKRNIKAIKLRGEKSEGLVLPLEVLSVYGDINKLNEGDTLTEFCGVEICKKYIPKTKISNNRQNTRNKKTKKRKNTLFKDFKEHVDTAQLAYNEAAFRVGDTCYITLKMHGTSGRTGHLVKEPLIKWLGKFLPKTYDIVTGTRRVVLDNFSNHGYYNDNQFRKQYHDLFGKKLLKGMTVYYEIVGYINEHTPIMPVAKSSLLKDKSFIKEYGPTVTFSYGCELGKSDCYVYRMTWTSDEGVVYEIPWEIVERICERWAVKTVPTLDKFIFTSWEDLMERVNKYVDGRDPIGLNHIREGVVVRIDNRETFEAYKHKNFAFKVLEGIIKEVADAPDREEAEEVQ